MKANEAPEKIFLEKEKETDRIHHLWGRTPVVSSLYEHIEYTRTDAFIKKACEWFRRIDYDDNIPPYETTEEFIEGFKKAMKGE